MAFAKDLQSLSQVIEEIGNPFFEWSNDLLVLNSRDVVHTSVADTVRRWRNLDSSSMKERLVNQTVPIKDAIKQNNLHIFNFPPVREKSKKQLQMSFLKSDCSLFSRLYIASQIRHGDLDEFFKYKNQDSHRFFLIWVA